MNKEKFKKLLIKIINAALLVSILILIFEITFADKCSFSNDRVDLFIHHTQTPLMVFILLSILVLLFLFSKKNWQKLVTSILAIPFLLIMLFIILFFSKFITMPDEVFVRHYFYQKDGYNYYIVSERYAAFESRNLIEYTRKNQYFYF